jgi:GNAT superfamily N-acetyltransferase
MVGNTIGGGAQVTTVFMRGAKRDDAPAITVLSGQLGYATSTGEVEAYLRAILDSPRQRVIVACRDDGSVVGWIHVFISLRVTSRPFGELGGLVVDEQFRGRGIGRLLLGAAEEWAILEGVDSLRVRSRSDRTDSHAFFERANFALTKDQLVFDRSFRLDVSNREA